MGVLRCKAGVRFDHIAPGGFRILAALDDACQVVKHDLLLTAGTNDHTTGRHPLGEAYDVSVEHLTALEIVSLVNMLRRRLGPEFGVFYEVAQPTPDPVLRPISIVDGKATGPHLHLQVAKGTTFPPNASGTLSI